jgi:hypothetical protein
VLAQFGGCRIGFLAGALQSRGEFALMLHLLFDPGDLGADAITLGLRLAQALVRFAVLAAARLESALRPRAARPPVASSRVSSCERVSRRPASSASRRLYSSAFQLASLIARSA